MTSVRSIQLVQSLALMIGMVRLFKVIHSIEKMTHPVLLYELVPVMPVKVSVCMLERMLQSLLVSNPKIVAEIAKVL